MCAPGRRGWLRTRNSLSVCPSPFLSLSLFLSVSLPSSTLSSIQRSSALCYSSSSLVYPIVVSFFPCFCFPFFFCCYCSLPSLFLFPSSLSLSLSIDLNSTRVHVAFLRKVADRTDDSSEHAFRRRIGDDDDDVSRRSTPGLVIDTQRGGGGVPVSGRTISVPLKAPGDIYKVSRGIFFRSPAISSSGSIGILHELFIESSAIVSGYGC